MMTAKEYVEGKVKSYAACRTLQVRSRSLR